jgi:hypothetical protein
MRNYLKTLTGHNNKKIKLLRNKNKNVSGA